MAMSTLPDWLKQLSPQNVVSKHPAWLSALRETQWQVFCEQGLPTRHYERYKHADFSFLYANEYLVSDDVNIKALSDKIHQHRLQHTDTILLVLVNGRFVSHLSDVAKLPEHVVAISLRDALQTQADSIKPHWLNDKVSTHSPFVNLNAALCDDGLYLYVPDECVIRSPIHLLHLTLTQSTLFTQSKKMVFLGKSSEVVFIEEHFSPSGSYVTNNVTTIEVNENAKLTYYKLQQESAAAVHVAHTDIQQKKDSCVELLYVGIGAQFARDDVSVYLKEQGSNCKAAGLYQLHRDRQYIDYHIDINHCAPRSQSEMFFKGILENKSKAVFNGRLLVENNASRIEAYQANHNLLLTNEAEVYSKPELEIYADEVKCKHGATTGQLNQDALFYLRARGISEEEAINMLLEGYRREILQRITHEGIKLRIQEALSC